MSGSLCERCTAFQRWPASTVEKWYRSAKFNHWATGTLLEASASKKCHFCMLIRQALLKSERPDDETNLPDRQIYLSFAPADLAGGGLRIEIKMKPESLEAAGRPKFNADLNLPVNIVSGPAKERSMEVAKSLGSMGVEQFWIVDYDGEYEYYRGMTEVSSAEFWSIVNPYHSASIGIYPMAEGVSSVLKICSTLRDDTTSSPAAFHLAKSWLTTCLQTHLICKWFAPLLCELPRRVVDVGPADGSILPRLHESSPGQKGFYVTLSHSWGTSNVCKTKNDNLENMKRKIPWDEISQTFKDAIHITRQFAFRFLWIDSLCIVQDDAEDWASQAPMMGTIYRQGIFNIAAVESDTPGCFRDREGALNRPCKLDIKVPDRFLPSDVLDIGPIHACPPEDLGAPDRAQAFRGPLDTRAWVLQEYMLSRRTLNYGKNMIFWDCLTKAVSESVPEGADTGDRSISDDYNFIQDFKNGLSGKLTELDNPQTKDGQIFTRAWFLTIEAYTRRNITYETDRLTALAGLATEYQKTTNDLYLAGLWKRNLLDGLLWSVWARGCPTAGNSAAQKGDHGPPGQRYSRFQAPSWSWASVSGYTRYFEKYGQDERVGQHFIAEVVEASCEPADPGIVSHSYKGCITLKGQLRKGIGHFASPFGDLDWKIQKQSDTAYEFSHLKTQVEKLRSVPLPTQTRQKDTREEGDRARETRLLKSARDVQANSGEASTSRPTQTAVDSFPQTIAISQPSYVNMPHEMLSHFASGIDFDELRTSLDIRGDSIGISLNALEKWGRTAIQNQVPIDDRSITTVDGKDYETALWPVHTLLDPETHRTVGLWAPDVSEKEYIIPTAMEIFCLAISRRKQYIWCLGLEQVKGRADEYRRVGLAYWNAKDWEDRMPKAPVSVKVV